MKNFLKGKRHIPAVLNILIILFFFSLIFSLIFCVNACNTRKQVFFSGKTMGTTWHITLASNNNKLPDNLEKLIRMRLDEINSSMSFFDRESELSHFNGLTNKGKICVSDDFIAVYKISQSLYKLTDGAWDGTIGPLVNLWGFGNKKVDIIVPDEKTIKEKLDYIGFASIKIDDNNCLSKEKNGLALDFASIAKGFAVDSIAMLLKEKGINNFLVEIGGEVYASGTKNNNKWKIGIKTPELSFESEKIYNLVELENMGLATSGDYRNFHEIDGVLYSHILNPKTGRPVTNNIASVSVKADNISFADGLATAIMVMGVKEGLKLVNSLKNVECLIIERMPEGIFVPHVSLGYLASGTFLEGH